MTTKQKKSIISSTALDSSSTSNSTATTTTNLSVVPKRKAKTMSTKSSSQAQQKPPPPSIILPVVQSNNPPLAQIAPSILIESKGPTIAIANSISSGNADNATSKAPDPGGSQQQHQPGSTQIISGFRTGSTPSVLQLHPIGTFRTTSSAGGIVPAAATTVMSVATKVVGGSAAGGVPPLTSATLTSISSSNNSVTTSNLFTTNNSVQPTPIISVNRSGSNLTILPARVPLTANNGGSTATLHFARGPIASIIRPAGTISASGGQPGSITVTPISGSSIRLAGATVTNGSWPPANNTSQGATFTPIRPVQVTATRAIRPETKVIHIPQQGTVQHLTQLQVVDGKGAAILKPQQLSGTAILRTIQTSSPSISGTPITVPITPSFTIRSATMPNSQRPQSSTTSVHKVITQPAHGQPIQLISGSKLPQHTIQTITPLPRLTLANPVCLTISTSAPLNANNSTPVVAVASKPGNSTNLFMNSALAPGSAIPLSKLYDMNPFLNIIAKSQSQTPTNNTGNVTLNVGATSATLPSQTTHAQVTVSATNPSMQSSVGGSQLIQVHAPMTVQGIPNSSSGSSPATTNISNHNTYIGSRHLSIVQSPVSPKPITLEKRPDLKINASGKNMVAANMILTTSQAQGMGALVNHNSVPITIPLGPQTFAHPISVASTTGNVQHQIINTSTSTQPAGFVSATTISGPATHSINILGTQQQSLTVGGQIVATSSIVQNAHVIPSQVVTSQSVSCPVTTSSITAVPSTTSVIVTTSSTLNSSSSITSSVLPPGVNNSTSAVSGSISNTPSIIVSNSSSNNLTSAVPAGQTPSQNSASGKATLSPRPSILRKRDAAASDNIQLRAQRNLALNFSLTTTSNSVRESSAASISNTVSATIASAANKENSNSSVSLPGSNAISASVNTGLSLLKKDFQPPNEESSWQSCSSNSSSGSTTLSTTSETAEIQMQQQSLGQLGVPIVNVNLTSVSSNSIYNVSNGMIISTSSATIHPSFNAGGSQNGTFRTINTSNTPTGRSRLSSTSKAFNKDLDRVKGLKGKDDHVSPRKKPRKQQLTTSDLLESSSSEISFYQGKRLKKNELMDPSLFQGFSDKLSSAVQKEEPPSQRYSYIIKKPHFSLIESDKLVIKTRLNHFQKYSDVKSKDERKPTLIELANQKDIMQKVEGWKLQHLNNHIANVIQTEKVVVCDFTSMLEKAEMRERPNNANRDLNKILELLKGNIQRCKVITDQMSEAKCQVSRILEHKASVGELLGKYVNKRPIKKRERL